MLRMAGVDGREPLMWTFGPGHGGPSATDTAQRGVVQGPPRPGATARRAALDTPLGLTQQGVSGCGLSVQRSTLEGLLDQHPSVRVHHEDTASGGTTGRRARAPPVLVLRSKPHALAPDVRCLRPVPPPQGCTEPRKVPRGLRGVPPCKGPCTSAECHQTARDPGDGHPQGLYHIDLHRRSQWPLHQVCNMTPPRSRGPRHVSEVEITDGCPEVATCLWAASQGWSAVNPCESCVTTAPHRPPGRATAPKQASAGRARRDTDGA